MSSLTQYAFLKVGFVWFNLIALAYIGTFILGPLKGGKTIARFHRVVTVSFIAGGVALLIYALVTGQLSAFLEVEGASTLGELLVFGFGWVGFMCFFSYSYVRNRLDNEEQGYLNPQGKSHA